MNRLTRIALFAGLCAVPTCAQSIGTTPGFDAHTVREENTSPHAFAAFVVGFAPDQLWFAGNHEVRRIWPDGSWTGVHTLPTTDQFGLFVASPDGTELFFTDFDTDTLFRHDVIGQSVVSQPVPANAFDLAPAPSGELLVTANPLFPAPNAATGVWLVDPLGSTNHREIVRLTGPSGPLAFDPANGDLLVAVIPYTLPPPPGSVQLLRFASATIQQALAQPGATALTAADAISSLALDGAYDMTFDDLGHVYVSDVNQRTIWRTERGAQTLEPAPFVAGGTDDVTSLQFVSFGQGSFRAFQPASGGTLFVGTAPSPARVGFAAVEPARPSLSTSVASPIPLGGYDLRLRGLPIHTHGWLCISARPLVAEIPVLSFDDRPLWFGLDLTAPVIAAPVALDPNGDATLTFQNLGAGITVSLQVLGLDSAGVPALVSSNTLRLQLLP
ncbi:MAG: hypothetical protein KDB80_11965 [Planctomycetes bacterium]|nr:hypothetical protein [Planctomycetota bacterium]